MENKKVNRFFWLLFALEAIGAVIGWFERRGVGCGMHIDLLHPWGYYGVLPPGAPVSMCAMLVPSPIFYIAIDAFIVTVVVNILWLCIDFSRRHKK